MDAGIIIGLGSACNKGDPSHVLQAMNVNQAIISSCIRISMSDYNTENDMVILVKEILIALKKIIDES